MRTSIAAGAVLAAGLSSVTALTSQELCNGSSRNEGGNFFCQAVNKITYTGINQSGNYQRTTNMDVNSKVCSKESVSYNTPLAPFDKEVSLHFRGPINLNKLFVYTPGSTPKAKRSEKERRHAHLHQHGANVEKRGADLIYATIDGKVVSWAANAAATPAPGAPSYGGSPGPAAAPGPSFASAPAPNVPLAPGDWQNIGSYDVQSKDKGFGLSFLNHKGADGVSGTWDMSFGNSLSYATSDGKSAAPKNTPFDGKIDTSAQEVIIMTDKQCSGTDCGYVRPKSVANHGFAGDSKAFFFEFSMPNAPGGNGMLDNAPALWMLNADVPRILQYGSDSTGTCCSCWSSGCGEFDIFEILASNDSKAKSTLHRQGNANGGDSNYFNRPTDKAIKLALVMYKSTISIQVLDDSFVFGPSMSSDKIQSILATNAGDQKASVFNIST